MGNKEEKIQKLEHAQKFFFISFLVSFGLMIICMLMWMGLGDVMAIVAEKLFKIDADDYNELFLFLMGFWKILIIQFTLIPAIAFCFLKKCCCNK